MYLLSRQLRQYDLMTSQPSKEPSEVDSQITDDDTSHTTDELSLDDAPSEPTKGSGNVVPANGTSSSSKPNLSDTNS